MKDWQGRDHAEMLPEDERGPLPETRSDEEALQHPVLCRCRVCLRPCVKPLKQRLAKARASGASVRLRL